MMIELLTGPEDPENEDEDDAPVPAEVEDENGDD